ncbi:hypothetical protein KALB_2289 [Kutzneria albida DSM 43870]|uniref:Carbohydrate kinase FGGY N-terminal domain-containing protein n=2 Tax=Kutzneria TaxID=43356 RepID=W5W397_9PSEU|nr:hypothetical protein KALB_2289 [Kutzneria albida DSM 43870]
MMEGMSAAGAVFGVQVGADAARVVALSTELTVLETTQLRYPAGVLDPYAALDVTLAAIERTVLACQARGVPVRGLCFAGAGDTLLGTDEADRPVTPVFTGADEGTTQLAARIRHELGAELHHMTGVPVHGGSALVRLAWFATHAPDLLASVARWCELKDFVLSRLSGRVLADTSSASAAGLLDTQLPAWSDTALRVAGVGADRLPPLADPNDQLPLSREAAELLGLPRGLPLVVGAAQDALSAVGLGLAAPGTASVTLESGPVLAALAGPASPGDHGRVHWHRVADGLWLVGATGDDEPCTVIRLDRIGRRLSAAREHLLATGVEVRLVRTGPAVLRIPMAAEVVATSLGVPVEIVADDAPAAMGAALLGLRALGVLPSLTAAATLARPWRLVRPDPLLTPVHDLR